MGALRLYREEDRAALLELYEKSRRGRSGKEDLLLADPSHSLHYETIVLEEEDGTLSAALTGRIACEVFLMIDHERGTGRDRWEALKSLIWAGQELLKSRGLTEAHVHTDDKRYARRLATLPGVAARATHHLFFSFGGD